MYRSSCAGQTCRAAREDGLNSPRALWTSRSAAMPSQVVQPALRLEGVVVPGLRMIAADADHLAVHRGGAGQIVRLLVGVCECKSAELSVVREWLDQGEAPLVPINRPSEVALQLILACPRARDISRYR